MPGESFAHDAGMAENKRRTGRRSQRHPALGTTHSALLGRRGTRANHTSAPGPRKQQAAPRREGAWLMTPQKSTAAPATSGSASCAAS